MEDLTKETAQINREFITSRHLRFGPGLSKTRVLLLDGNSVMRELHRTFVFGGVRKGVQRLNTSLFRLNDRRVGGMTADSKTDLGEWSGLVPTMRGIGSF